MQPPRRPFVLVGLSSAELQEPVASWFGRFSWAGLRLDLDTMTAAAFFERF